MRAVRNEIVVRRSAQGDRLGATYGRPRMAAAFYYLWLVIMGAAFVLLAPWILNVLVPG